VRWVKAGFFSPMVFSAVVIGAGWTWMYYPNDGLINATLELLGYSGERIGWLGDPDLATWAIIGAAMWRQVGYVMILYLAGLKNVDTSLVDAAKTDGASSFQTFKDVVLPMLTPVTVVVIVISIIDALRAFDLVQVMTQGGPANRTHVLSTWMYRQAFFNYNMGYGAAIAVVLMMIASGFIFIYLYRQVRQEMEY
jgi:multiple sugar transport system permease protein